MARSGLPRLHRAGPGLLAACAVLAVLAGCRPASPSAASSGSLPRFTDVTDAAGIRFQHNNGAVGKKFMPETVGSGCAFLDFDRDGHLDIFLVNSRDWPGNPSRPCRPALYRSRGDGSFEDLTRKAGLALAVYGMGAAVADYDNDGWDDLYVTCLGPNYLFRNQGDGTFRDVTAEAGVAGRPAAGDFGLRWKWSSSAAWLDYDRDGRLDLFVCNYVKWSPKHDLWCGVGGQKGYCPPPSYEPQPSILYHNDGGGRFRDVTAATGLISHPGKSFGVAVADYNADGWPDLAIANDTFPNSYLRNIAGKRFAEEAVEVGIALGETGNPRAGMGIDTADWDNSGRYGLVIGNFSTEGLALYRNDGPEVFTDVSHNSGLAGSSLLFLTFGVFFVDYDLDGRQDIFAGNGHIDDLVNRKDSRITYEQRPLLYRNLGTGSFEEVGLQAGAPLQQRLVVRGCAWGDYDNDGDPDILGVCSRGKAFLWRNEGAPGRHWVRLRLEGTKSNRSALGTLVRLRAAGVTQSRFVKSGGSFLSESDRRLLFGVGTAASIEEIAVTWPDGRMERIPGPLALDREYRIREGSGLGTVSQP